MEKLNETIFYKIEKAIKAYRQFAQKHLKEEGLDITIDQWLVIKCILDDPSISQQEIAEKVFKDNASVTRIIELLVKAGYLKRHIHPDDRRRANLKVTQEGEEILLKVKSIVAKYRNKALHGILKGEIENMSLVLDDIIKNCN